MKRQTFDTMTKFSAQFAAAVAVLMDMPFETLRPMLPPPPEANDVLAFRVWFRATCQKLIEILDQNALDSAKPPL